MNNSLLYSIAFSLMHGISTYSKTALIKLYGSAMAVFQERQKGNAAFKDAELNHREILLAAWPLKAAAEELETMTRLGIEPTCLEDAIYPNRLYQCQDAPILLFSKGARKFADFAVNCGCPPFTFR